MAPVYKVTYFATSGLAEPIRFLLSYGGVEFEDIRVPSEEWPKLKPTMPFGQMPVLEHKGKVAFQSLAICRYLAKQFNLAGKTDWENLEIDAIADTINDFRQKISAYYHETDEAAKQKKREVLFNEQFPFYLEKLDKIAKDNKGHLAVGRLTWADLYFASLIDFLGYIMKSDLIAERPNLVAVKNNVLSLPRIKAWIEKRPKSEV